MDQENRQLSIPSFEVPDAQPSSKEETEQPNQEQKSERYWKNQRRKKRKKHGHPPRGSGEQSSVSERDGGDQPQAGEEQKQSDDTRGRAQPSRDTRVRGERRGGTEISVVIPLYNENDSLKELASKVKTSLTRITNRWEVIFVDDGSTDGSFSTLREMYRDDRRFKVIRFRRNFGKSAGLSVGFQHAHGEYVVTMDADLQDDPEEIPRLIEKLKSGFDLVSGWKKKRRDPINKTLPSKLFNYVTGKLSGIKIHDFNCGLKAYRKEVVRSVHLYGEMHRYIPVLAKMQGFSVSEIPVTHHPRKYGKTKFGASRLYKGFLDLLTVLFTSRYTQRPLHLFGTLGMMFFIIGLVINVYLSVEWFMGAPISNRPMLWLGILLTLVGLQSVSTGLLAEMITKSQQASTHYLVRDVLK